MLEITNRLGRAKRETSVLSQGGRASSSGFLLEPEVDSENPMVMLDMHEKTKIGALFRKKLGQVCYEARNRLRQQTYNVYRDSKVVRLDAF